MTRRLSMELSGGGTGSGMTFGIFSRLGAVTLAFIVALVIAMAIGGALVGDGGFSWLGTWLPIDERTSSQPSAERVGPVERDPNQVDRANDDGYLDGVAKALGYESVEQMTRAGGAPARPNLVHR